VKTFLLALGIAVGGYVVGALLGMLLVSQFSGNTHDKSMEAGMTGFFFTGPVLAVLSFISALIYLHNRRPSP
jgi:hypothetical protein